MEPSSTQAGPTQAPPLADAGPTSIMPHLLRLAGHARLYVALLALILRLVVLLAIVAVWAIPGLYRVGMFNGPQFRQWALLISALAMGTVLVFELLLPEGRRPILRALLAGVLAIAAGRMIALAYSLLIAKPWYRDTGARVLDWGGLPSVIGPLGVVAIGVVLVAVVARLQRKAAKGAGHLDAMLALLPESEIPANRAALGRITAGAERAVALALLNVRVAVLLAPTALLVFLGYSYLEHVRTNAWIRLMKPEDAAIWLAIGAIAGVFFAVATLHLRAARAVLMSLLVVGAAIGFGGLYATLMHGGYQFAVARHWLLASAMASVGALLPLLVARWVLSWPLRRLLPLPVQRMLLPESPAASNDAVSHFAPSLHCESCGYSLQGLPESVCATCATASYRCPECGHAQPADIRYARLLRRMHRQHLLVRVQDIALRAGIAALTLFAAYALGSQLIWLVRTIDAAEVFLLTIVAGVLVGMLRYITLRFRPALLTSVLCGALPLVVAIIGAVSTARGVAPIRPAVAVGGVVGTMLLAVAFQWLWRGWLAVLLGRGMAGQVHRWETSAVYQRTPVTEIVAASGASLFREVPMVCGHCGRSDAPPAPQKCGQCGCHTVLCPACLAHTPLSITRAGLEALLYRARMMALASLALLASGFAVVMLLQLALHGQSASRTGMVWHGRVFMPEEFAYGMLLAAAGGMVASLLFVRRRAVIVAVCVCVFWFGTMRILIGHHERPAFTIYNGCEAAAAFIAALLARPFLVLASRVLLPKAVGHPLVAWLTGRLTLDQAASELQQGPETRGQ